MPTVFLHIGAPKTATSTLQRVLSRNDRQLQKQGVLYPRSCRTGDAHHALACDLIETHQEYVMPDLWYGDIPRQASWQLLRDEIAAGGDSIEKVILSTELLFAQTHRLKRMLDEIAAQLEGLDIKVVAYLRRQDQLYSSFYNQDVKGTRQWSGTAYEFYETHQLLRNDYVSILQSWNNAFGRGNVLVRPFESEQWPNGSIIEDFCTSVGIPTLRGTYRDQNESIGGTQLFMKRCLNAAGFPKEQNDKILKLLEEIFPEPPAKGLLYVNKPLYRKYSSYWVKLNDILSDKYLDSKPLFQQPIPKVSEVEEHVVRTEDITTFIENCLKTIGKGSKADYQPLFAKAIMMAAIELNMWEGLPSTTRETLQQWLGRK